MERSVTPAVTLGPDTPIFDPDYAWLQRWSFVSIPKEGLRFDHGPHNEKSGHDPKKTCLMIVEHNISYHTPL